MQPSPEALLAALALPFLGAALVPLVHRFFGNWTSYFGALIALCSFLALATQWGAEGAVSVPWIPSFGVALVLYVDGLALLLGFLATGIGVLVFAYSAGYMPGEPGQVRYYATLLAFMGAMVGVALAADLIALFVFWELTSVASFLLIGHYRDRPASLYAARKSLVITAGGGLFLLVGFLLLAVVSGDAIGARTLVLVGTEGSMLANADAMLATLRASGLQWLVLVLIAVGVAAKSAQVPLHGWLPNAMEAPTPVSAFLHAATMVKAGVYLVGRLRPLLLGEEWLLVFAALGLVTMAVTAALAVAATDIKELLAYSTASHLGLIVAGFALPVAAGAEAGAFHVVNHALFKAALFFVAGAVAHATATRRLDELGGLAAAMPVLAGVTVVAGLGMAGIPPFNGFYSKELLFEATWEVAAHDGGLAWLLPALAVLGSVFTVVYSLRFVMLFFGDRPADLHVHRPGRALVWPPLALATGAGLIGLGGVLATVGVAPAPLETAIGTVVDATLPGDATTTFHYYLPTTASPAALMSAVAIGGGLLAFPVRDRLQRWIHLAGTVPLWSPDVWYAAGMHAFDRASAVVPRYVQTGILRTYAGVLFTSLTVLALGGYLAAGVATPAIPLPTLALPAIVVLAVGVAAALALVRAPSHVAGVLTLSVVGFVIAVFYVLASAPDLALTQLVVETLLLVIFLLVLDRVPAFYGEAGTRRVLVDGAIALAVGATVTVSVLLATAATPADPIASFFLERAGVPDTHGSLLVDYGGGGNVVNVILVDFRALDTLGEIAVVGMAALAVITLVGMATRGEAG